MRVKRGLLRAAGEARDADDTPARSAGLSAARRAMRASVGPILPPTPSTMMSPSSRASVSTTRWLGSLSSVSS